MAEESNVYTSGAESSDNGTLTALLDIIFADPGILWMSDHHAGENISDSSTQLEDDFFGENNATLIVAPDSGVCNVVTVPTVAEYLAAISVEGKALLALALSAALLILVIYADTLRHLMRRSPARTKTHAAFVVSVYPVVALATLCAAVVPRAQLLAEAITQAAFTGAWYQLFCLLLAYCGGEAKLLRAGPEELTPRVPPCCCFWVCMPRELSINKRNLRVLRLLVLQLPAVQCLLYLALLVAWAEQQSLAMAQHVMLLQPFMFVSIFTGLWGMGMTVRMLAPGVLAGFFLREKMLTLQLVLILSKIQGLVVRATAWGGVLPCRPPLPPTVFGNLIYNTLIMTEMLVLMTVAWRLYKRPLPPAPLGSQRQHQQQTLQIVAAACKTGCALPTISAIVDEKVMSRGRQ